MPQPVATVRESEHPRRMGALAGEQRRPRPRADGCGTEGLAEEHSLIGHVLNVRRRNGIPVGLHVAARVVRVQVEDVWSHFSAIVAIPTVPLGKIGYSGGS